MAVTLDQLVALNDEMAALARAGVPLDQGLLHVGGDLPGKLGRISLELGRRLEAGEPLEHVLSDVSLPPAYRAVVAAGIRSGRLAVALEGVSAVLRHAAETRRLVAVSLVYPLLVIVLAYSLFVFMVDKIFPVMLAVYQGMLPDGRGLGVLQWIERTAPNWLPWLPPVVLGVLVLWWVRSRSVGRLEHGMPWRAFGRRWRIPTVGQRVYAGRMATFADTLALLIEHRVPYHEALRLAADASGDRGFRDTVRPLAERLERGETVTAADAAGLPPLLTWLFAARLEQPRLVSCLRRTADSYRRQAAWLSRWLAIYLPFWLIISLGGVATVLYVLSVVGPWARILYELSAP
jgi:type II secretory pathway component PulF